MSVQIALKSSIHFEIVSKPYSYLADNAKANVYILGSSSIVQRKKEIKNLIIEHGPHESIMDDKRVIHFNGKFGAVWILQNEQIKTSGSSDLFSENTYAWFRDQAGHLVSHFKGRQIDKVTIHFNECAGEVIRASLIGLEMAAYNFLNSYKKVQNKVIDIELTQNTKSKSKANLLDKITVLKAQAEAKSINLARHLVNLPPNEINPESIQQIVKKDLGFPKSVKVDVWNHQKLAAENMNLHLAVGKGAEAPPRMIHIRYRPQKKNSKKPIAFIGKGVTFDTGGLDIKPSSAMRLMKKDMGGAAAVLALAYWVIHSRYERACDFYLALAENSVDSKSMRPSDVYRSRAGMLVEIDNTDAEGRLVLADVMDVAVTQKGSDEPDVVIDIATLTGAIKVALGADVAGLFTNNDQLAQQIFNAGLAVGEPNWRMPLVQKYFGSMSSNFADFKNSADGFGGAITAALFLEKFCRGKKWAHLDVYCWNDKPTGALSFTGGSGQPVQSMIEWLKNQS